MTNLPKLDLLVHYWGEYMNIKITRLKLKMRIILLFAVKSQNQYQQTFNIFWKVIVSQDMCSNLIFSFKLLDCIVSSLTDNRSYFFRWELNISSLHWIISLSFCSFLYNEVYYDVFKLSVCDFIVTQKRSHWTRKVAFFG